MSGSSHYTPAQVRVLRFMRRYYSSGRVCTLLELQHIKLLQPDDWRCLEGLVERRLLNRYRLDVGGALAYGPTAAGEVIAAEALGPPEPSSPGARTKC